MVSDVLLWLSPWLVSTYILSVMILNLYFVFHLDELLHFKYFRLSVKEGASYNLEMKIYVFVNKKKQLTISRQISNYGIYCHGSSKCIITLQGKLALSTLRRAGAGGYHSNNGKAKYSILRCTA